MRTFYRHFEPRINIWLCLSQFMSHGTVDVYVQGTADDQKKYQGMDPWQGMYSLELSMLIDLAWREFG